MLQETHFKSFPYGIANNTTKQKGKRTQKGQRDGSGAPTKDNIQHAFVCSVHHVEYDIII